MAEIPHTGSVWRRGKAQVIVERVWQEEGRWTVTARFGNGTCAEMSAAEFLKQFRHVAEPAEAAAGG